jgi:hypothetical protein
LFLKLVKNGPVVKPLVQDVDEQTSNRVAIDMTIDPLDETDIFQQVLKSLFSSNKSNESTCKQIELTCHLQQTSKVKQLNKSTKVA